MSITRSVVSLTRQSIRQFSNTSSLAKGSIPEGYHQLKVTQAKFQVHDGKPVHLKGGVTDQLMYRVTMGLTVVGIVGILKLIYDLSMPKQNE